MQKIHVRLKKEELDAQRLEQGRVTWLRRGWPTLFAELVEHLPRLADFV